MTVLTATVLSFTCPLAAPWFQEAEDPPASVPDLVRGWSLGGVSSSLVL